MSDPVLIVGVVGLAAAVAGPFVLVAVARLRGGVASVPAPALVPSRYRWSGQEIQSLGWAVDQLPADVTLAGFVTRMNADDMVSETCVALLSPEKGVAK